MREYVFSPIRIGSRVKINDCGRTGTVTHIEQPPRSWTRYSIVLDGYEEFGGFTYSHEMFKLLKPDETVEESLHDQD